MISLFNKSYVFVCCLHTGILVNIKHKPAFTYDYDISNKTVCLADENGNKLPTRVDVVNGGYIRDIANNINIYAEQHNIPIIF